MVKIGDFGARPERRHTSLAAGNACGGLELIHGVKNSLDATVQRRLIMTARSVATF